MKNTLDDIIEALESEEDYQEGMWLGQKQPSGEEPMSVGEFILMLREYVDQAQSEWMVEPKPEKHTLHMIRKIAYIAVACMKEHGAPKRGDL